MQQITITGNIGGDATLTQGQRPQYRFSVGVYNGKDQQGNSKTAWYTCFAPTFQWLEGRLLKGTKVTVNGNLSPDIYIGNDGMAKLDLIVNVDAVEVHDVALPNPQQYTPGQGAYNPVVAAGAAVAAGQSYRQPARATAPQAPAAPARNYPPTQSAYAQATQPVADMPNI